MSTPTETTNVATETANVANEPKATTAPNANEDAQKPKASKKPKATTAPNPNNLAFKITEAAALISVQPLTIRRLIERGQLKACRQLRHVLISREELNRFLSA